MSFLDLPKISIEPLMSANKLKEMLYLLINDHLIYILLGKSERIQISFQISRIFSRVMKTTSIRFQSSSRIQSR